MIKKNVIMVLDTETADLAGNVYDVGAVITDRKGIIVDSFNALVEEVFTDGSKMLGAFYAKKLFSHYAPMLQAGTILMRPWSEIVDGLRSLVLEHEVNIISAYNLAFDLRVMKSTNALFSDTPVLPPQPYKLLDIWRFACMAKLNSRLYKEIAINRGWVSDAGNIRTGAEYAYRFCSGDFGFIESHTALSDAEIENDILRACFATRTVIPYDNIEGDYAKAPWRIVNPPGGKK